MPEETKDSTQVVAEDPGGLKITRARGKGGARPLSIDPVGLPTPVDVDRRNYWCGVTEDCPRMTVHAGGFDFPSYTQKQVSREGSDIETILGETRFAGRVHEMTEGQAKWCIEGIANRVIRRNSHRDLVTIHGNRKPFRPMEGDEPLAKYVYMIEVDDPSNVNYAYPAPNVTTLISR